VKFKFFFWFIIFWGILLAFGWAETRTYSLSLRYQPMIQFHSLQEKFGSTLGVGPFKDKRQETLYVGTHTPFQGLRSYFKSNPFPLETAIQESLIHALSRSGIKTVKVSDWDGKPESLKDIDLDSVLTLEIKKFWTEGKASLFRTNIKTTVQLVIHLGVKKERKVFTRTMELEKEMTVPRATPEKLEAILNQMLSDSFDAFFASPY